MDKEFSVWWRDYGEFKILRKNEKDLEGEKCRLLAQFNEFEEAYAYSTNLDESGVFQGNIVFPQTGHKDNNGYYFLTQLHKDDVIQAIKDYCDNIDEESIKRQLTEQVMRKVAEDIVDSLLIDLYWTSIIGTLENELPGLMEILREREN